MPEKAAAKKRINAVLIAGGKYHDIDFARLELLKLLAEDERVRVRVFEDYSNVAAIQAADFLVTYTCDVMPSLEAQEALKAFVEGGKRWYALHGTNSILRFLSPEGAGYGQLLVDSPRWAPLLMETLGSQFIAHPPIAPFRVEVTQPKHKLVKGVAPFDTDDELYLMETHGELDVMLHCEFAGEAPGFVEKEWAHARHPVFYTHAIGKGAVLYLTLGHCRGHYDMPGIADYYPAVERCAWNLPVFYDLLRRGIAWVKEPIEA
ncbi:MAG: ThuA domain-containing protein [Alphaproteobacteria bacterium]|nr:ThuA domain-containing protein [Alphaproteobacteria bacterium]